MPKTSPYRVIEIKPQGSVTIFVVDKNELNNPDTEESVLLVIQTEDSPASGDPAQHIDSNQIKTDYVVMQSNEHDGTFAIMVN